MSSANDVHFTTHVTWAKDGHTYYVSVSGVAEPLEVEDPDPDAEQPQGTRTGVVSVHQDLVSLLRRVGCI